MVSLPADDEEYAQETRDASPSHLLTKITSFSMLSKHEITELESMDFAAGDYKWKVVINVDGGEHISVNLCMVGTSSLPAGWEVNAIFTFFLYNHISDKYLCFRGKARRFHAINPEQGFSNLITKNSLTDPANGYLFKDQCVFGAEVFVIKTQPLIQEVSLLKSSNPYKREWKISEYSKLGSIWKSEEFSAGGYKWEMMIYPDGSSEAHDRYVGVYLSCIDATSFGNYKKVNVACVFCFKNKLNDRKHRSSLTAKALYTSTNTSWGFDEFIAIGDMRDPRKGFLVDDCCDLEIQLSVNALHEATSHTGV